jgi:hypothetical protein
MIRRIVTGHQDGKSVVVSDEPLRNTREYTAMKGLRTTLAWTTPAVPTLPYDGSDPTASVTSIIPGPGGTTLLIVNFPPDAVMLAPDFDEAVATAEYAANLPGLAELFEPENPGMHTTHTLDYDILLDGEIWLELDDGVEVKVGKHDIVVQNGVRHAWRNKSDRPATMAFILFGAQR